MYLENFNKVRIKRYSKGFVVEMQFRKWYGKKYWKHIISINSEPKEPMYYHSFDSALKMAERYFRFDLMNGTDSDDMYNL